MQLHQRQINKINEAEDNRFHVDRDLSRKLIKYSCARLYVFYHFKGILERFREGLVIHVAILIHTLPLDTMHDDDHLDSYSQGNWFDG